MKRKWIIATGLGIGSVVICMAAFSVWASSGLLGHNKPFGHGAGMHCMMQSFVDELDLTDQQQAYLDNAHEVLKGHVHGKLEGGDGHEQWLLEAINSGNVDSQELREVIDKHIEEARTLAYGVGDELVLFVNSLDDEQRAKLLEHIEKAHDTIKAHGHELHGHGDGRH